MGRGYRLAIIALGLTLFAYQAHSQEAEEPTLESVTAAEEEQPERASASEEIAAPEQQDTPLLAPVIQGVETSPGEDVDAQHQDKDADEIQRQKDDLDAQQRMADWAMWMFIAAVGSLLLTGVGVILIWWTLEATRAAVKEAAIGSAAAQTAVVVTRKNAEDQIRPYVHVSKMTFEWGQSGIRVVPTCRNSGQTPATFFEVGVMAFCRAKGSKRKLVVPRKLNLRPWSALGGGQENTVSLVDERWANSARLAHDSAGVKNFVVVGRVQYGDVFGNEYESEFVYFTHDVRPNEKPRMMSRSTGRFRTFHQTKKADDPNNGDANA